MARKTAKTAGSPKRRKKRGPVDAAATPAVPFRLVGGATSTDRQAPGGDDPVRVALLDECRKALRYLPTELLAHVLPTMLAYRNPQSEALDRILGNDPA